VLEDIEGLWFRILTARYNGIRGGYRRVSRRGRRGGRGLLVFVTE